jgi:hypothetical protein
MLLVLFHPPCCCLQLAVLAEFRQDWLAAVSSYQAAAAALQGVPLGRPTVSCQRHAEVAAVAEVVHFKAMMLLLHQQRYGEAIQQLRGHLAAFGPLPGGRALCCDVLSRGVLQWMLGTCYIVAAAECNTVSAVLLLFLFVSAMHDSGHSGTNSAGMCGGLHRAIVLDIALPCTAADGLPLAAAAAHYGWLSRQYQGAAEMIATSRLDEAVLQVGQQNTTQ